MKMVIFHSYVSLPEGIIGYGSKFRTWGQIEKSIVSINHPITVLNFDPYPNRCGKINPEIHGDKYKYLTVSMRILTTNRFHPSE